MPMTLTKSFGRLADLPLVDRAFMREVGLLARERILRRTLAGQDQAGAAFAPYSPSYLAIKAKELGTTAVNLQVSGRMLQGLVITDISENSVTLGFSS